MKQSNEENAITLETKSFYFFFFPQTLTRYMKILSVDEEDWVSLHCLSMVKCLTDSAYVTTKKISSMFY